MARIGGRGGGVEEKVGGSKLPDKHAHQTGTNNNSSLIVPTMLEEKKNV